VKNREFSVDVIKFDDEDQKLRKKWDALTSDDRELLRQQKRLLLLWAHPVFKEEFKLLLEQLWIRFVRPPRSYKVPGFARTPIWAKTVGEFEMNWNVCISSNIVTAAFHPEQFYNKTTTFSKEDYFSKVLENFEWFKYVIAFNYFCDFSILNHQYDSFVGYERRSFISAQAKRGKNVALVEINLFSPSFEHKSGFMSELYVKLKEFKDLLERQTCKDAQNSQKDYRNDFEAKFQMFSGIRSHMEQDGSKKKNFKDIYHIINKLEFNIRQRDLLILYLKKKEDGKFFSLLEINDYLDKRNATAKKPISAGIQDDVDKEKKLKKFSQEFKYLYFFIDQNIYAQEFIANRSRKKTHKKS
jgi:hypothetical protein